MRGTCRHAAFRCWFGLRNREADVLCRLFEADGQIVALSVLGPGCVEHVRVLREAMKAEAIDTRPGHGYRLTDAGMAECRVAFADMARELEAA